MKVYITEDLIFRTQEIADDSVKAQEIIDYLKSFSIRCKIQKDNFIFIEKQKITLNEIDMNELFDEVFNIFDIDYACMGGKGCDFNINVSQSRA